jgi:hypothetical protein
MPSHPRADDGWQTASTIQRSSLKYAQAHEQRFSVSSNRSSQSPVRVRWRGSRSRSPSDSVATAHATFQRPPETLDPRRINSIASGKPSSWYESLPLIVRFLDRRSRVLPPAPARRTIDRRVSGSEFVLQAVQIGSASEGTETGARGECAMGAAGDEILMKGHAAEARRTWRGGGFAEVVQHEEHLFIAQKKWEAFK